MAFDKIQAKAIDTDSAPERGSVTDDDFVLIRNANTGEFERVKVSALLSGTTGSIRLSGEADFTDPSTTLTTVVINGDSDNATITQGTAPTDPSPIGVAYLVKAASGGTTTEISGVSETVFNNDQLLWSGTGWTILSLGQTVTSVNGQTGAVTIDAISETQADAKYALKASSVDKSGDTMSGDLVFPNSVAAKFGNWTVQEDGTDRLVFFYGNDLQGYLTSDGEWHSVQVYDSGNRVYSPANKPTPADIGALSTSYTPAWSTITGKPSLFPTEWDQVSGKPVTFPADWTNINGRPNNFAFTDQINTFTNSQNFNIRIRGGRIAENTFNHILEDSDAGATYRTDNPNYWRMCGPNSTFLYANHNNNTLDTVRYDLYEKGERVYSPNNKPTAADVGAVPISGGCITGGVDVKGTIKAYALSSAAPGRWGFNMGMNAKFPWIAPTSDGDTPDYSKQLRYLPSSGKWQANDSDIFTKEFPPTASEVGAHPDTWVPDWSQITNKPSSFPVDTISWDGVTDKPEFATRWPTAEEAGALPNTLPFITSTDDIDFSRLWYGTLSNSNPDLGGQRALLRVPTSNGGVDLAFRTISPEYNIRVYDLRTGEAGAWDRLYSEQYPPTASAVGAPDANDVYTKTESDSRFAPATHNHDDLYYRKSESDSRYLAKTGTASDSQALEGRTYTQVVDAASQGKVPDTRTVNGKELSADISITKGDVGLSQVNNWPASSATNLDSDQTYATSSAVKAAYDRATTALSQSGSGISLGGTQAGPYESLNSSNSSTIFGFINKFLKSAPSGGAYVLTGVDNRGSSYRWRYRRIR